MRHGEAEPRSAFSTDEKRKPAEAALEVLGVRELEIKVSESLEPTPTPYEFYEVLSKLDRKTSRILAISHQPFVSALLSDLLAT